MPKDPSLGSSLAAMAFHDFSSTIATCPLPSMRNHTIGKIQTWTLLLMASWTVEAGAENASYVNGGLKFSGSSEAVQIFKEAAIAYDEADRVQAQIRKEKLPSTPENDERTKEASSRWYSTREAMYKAALDLKIAPGTADSSSTQGEDMLGTRRDIRTLNLFISEYQNRRADKPGLYLEWLQEMLPAWKDSVGEVEILLELGRLSENDPAIALAYYDRAAKDARDIDQFQFRRQQAYQGVARMCEKLGNYKQALTALEKWDIHEPCGTGANGSRIQRMFWMWRLRRLSGEAPLTLRRELVQALQTDGWLISCAERDIIEFYGKNKAALRQDITTVIQTFEKSSEENRNSHDHDINVLKAILTLLDEKKMLALMTDDDLIRALQPPKKRLHDHLPPTPIAANVLFHSYREQNTEELASIPAETRFWVRAAQEALRRMPALGDKLQIEWRKNNNYAAAMVLALHAAPDEPVYLRDAAKTDGQLQSMLYDMMMYRKIK